ncbi:MAG TPA: hypothetical protein DDX89_05910 [Candidatus Omnitrophica bacterium]|nr:MAG: hypothetical protein A2Z92_05895 [Omnitrophica WOR_2 bacterium GWA2_63_20]OGX31157.1 MAG: hypothetical protein A3E56_04010 [Omnitrophica WOR_2 bacterium RIFCSPHIGHO2_12_FULL_64_13]OGX36648.1 MAG: hypothetical protein A3B73_02650 [Omnitrophica WOR_2 bacterium RIFCSPHIGHO2_02_FULL_63_39]OGX45049.1 MAG: hypothetical protein A3I71_04040 [Omnitrophica WOR_2 bacterium RIFCSPLOWO2_02_FULL_63_16]OGX50017.1 MAG: hypothetical protein A3G88_07230 [Omnitrophica WOR_2 bacterium RIFCSPLOWO2_12_FULL_6
MMWVAVVLGLFLAAVLIYVVSVAVRLKDAAGALHSELQAFKEGKVDQLIGAKLSLLTNRAAEELASREKAIQDVHLKLVDQEEKTRKAAEQFKNDLGTITAQIAGLMGLQPQITELNDLLKPQQLRGELGEVIVRRLIADKFPPAHYEEDYAFADGKKVEFVIRVDDRLIPVDSKFQLEDFKRLREAPEDRRQALRTEIKRKIRQKIDEVQAYIKPKEGTYPFALMVIPSEAVYYEVIAQKDFVEPEGLYDYARAHDVFLVSPLTFWAYLTVIAQGLRGLEIGRRSEEILASLETIASRLQRFAGDEFRVLGDHLRNAKAKYDEACDALQEIDGDLTALKRLNTEQPTEQGANV